MPFVYKLMFVRLFCVDPSLSINIYWTSKHYIDSAARTCTGQHPPSTTAMRIRYISTYTYCEYLLKKRPLHQSKPLFSLINSSVLFFKQDDPNRNNSINLLVLTYTSFYNEIELILFIARISPRFNFLFRIRICPIFYIAAFCIAQDATYTHKHPQIIHSTPIPQNIIIIVHRGVTKHRI